MNLTSDPQVVNFPPTHYVFVEKVGPFQNTAPGAWQSAHTFVPELSKKNQITGYMSLYKVGPQVYRAGVAVAEPPANLPDGLKYEKFPGGKYSKFVLTDSYSQLPQASGRAFELAQEHKLPLRDGFNI